MRMRGLGGLISGVLLGVASLPVAAHAADETPSCPAPGSPGGAPDAPAGWATPRSLAATRGHPAAIATNAAVAVALVSSRPDAAAPTQDRHHPAGDYTAVLAFTPPAAGRYRVMLSDTSWIDVTHDGTLIDSVSHRHGPPCSGVRKMVDFPLPQGESLITLSGVRAASVTLMVAPAD